MGEVVQVACQGFLVREACVGVLVGAASQELWEDLLPGYTLARRCPGTVRA